MLTRLTGFIRLYGVTVSAMVFSLLVFVAGVGGDLSMHLIFGIPFPDPFEVLIAAGAAAVVTFVVIYPFCLAALRVEDKEAEIMAIRADLRESEIRLRDFADAASDWYWEMDADLRFTYVSPRIFDATGVPPEFHIGKTREELADDNATNPKWQAHKNDLANRRPFKNFQYAREGPDGQVQRISTSGRPVYGPTGVFQGYRGVGTDMTPQFEAERRAREADELLRAAIDGMSEVFVLWGPDDRLVIWNERFAEVNREALVQTKRGTLYADHLRRNLEAGQYPQAAGREEKWLAEQIARHANPNGSFEIERPGDRWFLVNEQRLRNGSTVALAIDITAQKRAERSSRESEQRLRDFASVGADWFWEQDENLRFTYVSHENEGVSGMLADEHYGKNRRETEPEGISERELAAHEALLEAHQPFADFRFSRTRNDGSVVYLSISGRPVFDPEGAFTGYRGVGRDITPMVEAERELRVTRFKAEQANLAKSQFLARMSHDLRTPLTAILGFSEFIELQLAGELPDSKYIDYARNIRSSGRVLMTLISNILDLSKIEAGKYHLDERPLAVAEVLKELDALFRAQASAAGIQLTFAPAPADAALLADECCVQQALMNLISNALNFSDRGDRVTVTAGLDDDGFVFTVEDTGVGFDMTLLDRILEPFGRGVSEGAGREGTGLGLAIVKSLMELHDGALELDSTPGQGTIARLRFPAGRSSAPPGTISPGVQ